MALTSKLLYAAVAVLTIDALMEMAFIATTVSWLHRVAGKGFYINYQGDQFLLQGKPLNILLDQGHASNGAAGTIYVAIGFFGALALYLRHRQLKRDGGLHGFTKFAYNFWLVMTILSAIFSLACFIYVFALTYNHDNQSINLSKAAGLNNPGPPHPIPYPDLEWTPQNWFPALLRLPIASDSDRNDISNHLKIMRGWQWNLIPMTLLGFLVMALAFMEKMTLRQRESRAMGAERLAARKVEEA